MRPGGGSLDLRVDLSETERKVLLAGGMLCYAREALSGSGDGKEGDFS